jgi:hypothetical protein
MHLKRQLLAAGGDTAARYIRTCLHSPDISLLDNKRELDVLNEPFTQHSGKGKEREEGIS